MKHLIRYVCLLALTLSGVTVLSSFLNIRASKPHFSFPYKQAGLTERQAAAHLLSRFTYGPTPGEIDAVVKQGLEKWFTDQLDGKLPDDSVSRLLEPYDALKLPNREIAEIYPKRAFLVRQAVKDGVINKDSVKSDRKEYRDVLQKYMADNGYKPEQELQRQLFNQKVLRAAYSNNQLHEVLTDFWFNHFNVSLTKNDCSQYIVGYERDVIRPNVAAKFGDLLLATAKSPAMLYYLDNFNSAGDKDKKPQANPRKARLANQNQTPNNDQQMMPPMPKPAAQKRGLNENYAREVMELHTLGVDGGYSQQDVTQAAKVLTGWTVVPMGGYAKNNPGTQRLLANKDRLISNRGYIFDGDFMFNADRHDGTEKTVMGKKFGPNNGYQEGVELLDMLAHHASTAKFITKKLAVRFVSDAPPQSLLDKMAKTYKEKDGSIREVLITMASAPEFWTAQSLREKTKSPFELVISSVRSLDASINQPYQLYAWANKMGQRLYAYQAPTGFPDRSQYWINTGALLNRMNFGLALATQRIPGVRIDLAKLNNHHEPESPEAALHTYAKLIMPERNLDQTVKQLTPMLNDPNLVKKIDDAASKAAPANRDKNQQMSGAVVLDNNMMMANSEEKPAKMKGGKKNGYQAQMLAQGNNSMLAQVVGVIIGSPEYQRR